MVRYIAKLLYQLYQNKNCSSIAWNSNFKGEPCFPHGMKSIFVSGDAKIGKDCVIFQQVVIGSVTLPDSKNSGAPIIGDNCYIGAGAKIIGNVKIGSNVRIGANTVVYNDVPDNSVVVSARQTNICKDNRLDNRFYTDSKNWKVFESGQYVVVKDPKVIDGLNRAYK
jgi:serine O-acetyltransferase